MKPRKKRKISGIRVDEISLVDFGAVGKSFFVMKRDKNHDAQAQDPELEKLLEGWADEALLKMTGEEAAVKLKAALEKLQTFKEDLPDPIVEAVSIILNVGGAYGSRAKDEGQDADDDQGDDQDVQDDEQKAKLKKSSDRFPSMRVTGILAGSHKFQKNLRKAAAAADAGDDADEDDELVDEDPADEVAVLKREIAMKDRLIEKLRLRRGKSSQAKTGVDDDDHFDVEKDSGIDPKTLKPTRDLFPSWSLF